MSRTGINVADLNELIDFQSKLRQLSKELQNIYDFLKKDLTELSCEWEDQKFYEFDEAFEPKKEEIGRISESYRDWANGPLQETIERLTDVGGTSVG